MQEMGSYTDTRNKLIKKIHELKNTSNLLDKTLETELDFILEHLMESFEQLEPISEEASMRLIQLELLVDQLCLRIQKTESPSHSWGDEKTPSTVTPEKLIGCLKKSGISPAQLIAQNLEELILFLTDLTKVYFRGPSENDIRIQADLILEELLGHKTGESNNYWRILPNYGAAKAIAIIDQDPTGAVLRNLIENESIDLIEITLTLKRMIKRTEIKMTKLILIDLERDLNSGQLEYICPLEQRNVDDPFILRLSKYINPDKLIISRLVTSSERLIRDISIDVLKEVLHTVDDIEAINSQIKGIIQNSGGWIERKIKQQDELLLTLYESTDSLNVSSTANESETETTYLRLLLLKYALNELNDRFSLFHSKLIEDAPAKLIVAFLNRKLIHYTKYIVDWSIKPGNIRELQIGLNYLRNALQIFGTAFSLGGIDVYTEQLTPDYVFLFPHETPVDLNHIIGIDKSLKKCAEKIIKIAQKEKDPVKAWTKLQDLMDKLQQEIRS